MDLEKLTRDCRAARNAATEAAAVTDDGGSCNLDSTFMRLDKGVRTAPVVAAIKASGLHASPGRWLGRGIFIDSTVTGQGSKRSLANDALARSLREAGWRVSTYYQMD